MRAFAPVFVLAFCFAATGCAEPSFEDKLAASKANIASEEGRAYDAALTQAMVPAGAAIVACYRNNPGKKDVHGYFEFVADETQPYSVTLRPQDAFTDCLEKAMENLVLPPPPRRPYLNYASFVYEPKAGGG